MGPRPFTTINILTTPACLSKMKVAKNNKNTVCQNKGHSLKKLLVRVLRGNVPQVGSEEIADRMLIFPILSSDTFSPHLIYLDRSLGHSHAIDTL